MAIINKLVGNEIIATEGVADINNNFVQLNTTKSDSFENLEYTELVNNEDYIRISTTDGSERRVRLGKLKELYNGESGGSGGETPGQTPDPKEVGFVMSNELYQGADYYNYNSNLFKIGDNYFTYSYYSDIGIENNKIIRGFNIIKYDLDFNVLDNTFIDLRTASGGSYIHDKGAYVKIIDGQMVFYKWGYNRNSITLVVVRINTNLQTTKFSKNKFNFINLPYGFEGEYVRFFGMERKVIGQQVRYIMYGAGLLQSTVDSNYDRDTLSTFELDSNFVYIEGTLKQIRAFSEGYNMSWGRDTLPTFDFRTNFKNTSYMFNDSDIIKLDGPYLDGAVRYHYNSFSFSSPRLETNRYLFCFHYNRHYNIIYMFDKEDNFKVKRFIIGGIGGNTLRFSISNDTNDIIGFNEETGELYIVYEKINPFTEYSGGVEEFSRGFFNILKINTNTNNGKLYLFYNRKPDILLEYTQSKGDHKLLSVINIISSKYNIAGLNLYYPGYCNRSTNYRNDSGLMIFDMFKLLKDGGPRQTEYGIIKIREFPVNIDVSEATPSITNLSVSSDNRLYKDSSLEVESSTTALGVIRSFHGIDSPLYSIMGRKNRFLDTSTTSGPIVPST